MDALNYAIGHDDGQGGQDLERADVILVGVSRTSKTPTSIYLAHRGVRAHRRGVAVGKGDRQLHGNYRRCRKPGSDSHD